MVNVNYYRIKYVYKSIKKQHADLQKRCRAGSFAPAALKNDMCSLGTGRVGVTEPAYSLFEAVIKLNRRLPA